VTTNHQGGYSTTTSIRYNIVEWLYCAVTILDNQPSYRVVTRPYRVAAAILQSFSTTEGTILLTLLLSTLQKPIYIVEETKYVWRAMLKYMPGELQAGNTAR